MVRLTLILAILIQPLALRPGAVSAQVHEFVGSINTIALAHGLHSTLELAQADTSHACCDEMDPEPPAPRALDMACCDESDGAPPASPLVEIESCEMSYDQCAHDCFSVPLDPRPSTPMPMHHAGSHTFSWLVARPRPIALIGVPEPTAIGQTRVVRGDLASQTHGLSQALRGVWHT